MKSLKIDINALSEETKKMIWEDFKQKLGEIDGESDKNHQKAYYKGLIRQLEKYCEFDKK